MNADSAVRNSALFEPLPIAAALVTAGSAAGRLKHAAEQAATSNRAAREPAKNVFSPIIKTMLDNGPDSCKVNVGRAKP